MATLKLFNTELREKEEVIPQNGKTLLMYTCGPTVYNFAHIGNFRCYVFEDLLRRTIRFLGYDLRHVMNITDVEDKTIKGSIEEGISLSEFTQKYTKAFFEDLATLHIEQAEEYPRATEYIGHMIKMIDKLMKEGIAYRGHDGSIYFSIEKFPSYGRLSHLNLDELKQGASERVGTDEYDKENAADFVLWKAYDKERDGDVVWDSPFGKGRPGWHIECSAMATHLLGESIDIHCGGVDNIFPHHENEIAQSEACSGVHFVRYWAHAEHLLVENKKMSKSLGNFYTLRDLIGRGYSGREVRYLLLQTHYRTQLNFTMDGLQGAKQSLQRLSDFIYRLRKINENSGTAKIDALCEKTLKQFTEALSDDLNISVALAALFDLVREVNVLCDKNAVSQDDAQKILELLAKLDQVLGVLPLDDVQESIPTEIQEALERRQKARAEKNWKEADIARDYIQAQGYIIEDTPKGPQLKKRS